MNWVLPLYNCTLKRKVEHPVIGAYTTNNNKFYVIIEIFAPNLKYLKFELQDNLAIPVGLLTEEEKDEFVNKTEGKEYIDQNGMTCLKQTDYHINKRLNKKIFVDLDTSIAIIFNDVKALFTYRAKTLNGDYIKFTAQQIKKIIPDARMIKVDSHYCMMGTEELYTSIKDSEYKEIAEGDLVTVDGIDRMFVIRYLPNLGRIKLVNANNEIVMDLENAMKRHIKIVGNVWTDFMDFV